MKGRLNKKEVAVDNSSMIQKSNELSMAKMSQGLTLNQMQLLAYAIYATQKDKATTFVKADFERKFDLEKYLTGRAKEDVQKLLDIKFSYEDLENDEFEYWNVFQSIKYKEGTFQFKWTDDMLPHILDLKDKYVLTDLTVTSQFKSSFSWTLYDFLRAKFGCWYITLSKEAIMNLFGVESGVSYQKNTSLFKRKVLDVAIKEVNKFTELEVSYDEEKTGRSITGFTLKWSSGRPVKKASNKQKDILQRIVSAVFDDAFMYMEIKDNTNRQRALGLIRELQEIKYLYLDTEVGLTANHCSHLTRRANDNLEALNYLLEQEGKEPVKPHVPLHNWVEG